MSISYSGLVSHGKVTFPSVESWGNSMNILKDPPKSIHTRRKNKVGSTSSITEEIDAATDRACEAIRVYARGTNPAVSVMYRTQGAGPQGGIGGAAAGVGTSDTNRGAPSVYTTQASLPFKIMNGGAFRPPVLTQRELLPLSRQPREQTGAYTRAGFADWTKKLTTCGTASDYRQVKDVMQTYDVTAPKACKRGRGMEAPYEIKYSVKDNLAAEAYTNKMDKRAEITNRSVMDTDRFMLAECLRMDVQSAKRDVHTHKPGVVNNLKNRPKNIPNFAWERGAAPKKDYSARQVNATLGAYTKRGSFDGRAAKPMTHA